MWNWQSQLLGGGGGTGARVSRTQEGNTLWFGAAMISIAEAGLGGWTLGHPLHQAGDLAEGGRRRFCRACTEECAAEPGPNWRIVSNDRGRPAPERMDSSSSL